MSYDQILGLLSQFNLYAWIIAMISSFFLLRYTQNQGWVVITIGSLFVVLRQGWKFLPGYKAAQESDFLFNAYLLRFLFGSTGAILLIVGFIMLIVSYYVLKVRMEA